MNGALLALGAVGTLALVARRVGAANRVGGIAWELDPGPLVWFHPLDFLRLTSTPGDSRCLRRASIVSYQKAMRRGDRFVVPVLSVSRWDAHPDDGCAVVAHDGRHRALAAFRLGAAAIPVHLEIDDRQVPLAHLLSGAPSVWLSQAYDDEEVAECDFENDQELRLKNLHPEHPSLP